MRPGSFRSDSVNAEAETEKLEKRSRIESFRKSLFGEKSKVTSATFSVEKVHFTSGSDVVK
jgi:hypothetical protein